MKKLLFALSLLFINERSIAQRYEYCFIIELPKGMRNESSFVFPTEKQDSAKAYGTFKLLIDAIDYASKKDWEVMSVTTQQSW